MINFSIDAVLIKVAAMGLDPKVHLGKSLKDVQPLLVQLVYFFLFVFLSSNK